MVFITKLVKEKIKILRFALMALLVIVLLASLIPVGIYANAQTLPILSENAEDVAPNPATKKITKGRFILKPGFSHNRVLNVVKASKKNSANVTISASTMSTGQAFDVVKASGSYVYIKNVKSKKMLNVAAGKKKSGTNVNQYKKNGKKQQKWKLVYRGLDKYGQSSFALRSALASNLYLNVKGKKNKNGTNVRIIKSNLKKAQTFNFVSIDKQVDAAKTQMVANGVYKINSKLNTSYKLYVSGAERKNGSDIKLTTSSTAINQLFQISFEGGYYKIRPITSTKYLDVTSDGVVATTQIQQWSNKSSSKQQKFSIKKNTDGSVSFIAIKSGKALDVYGAKASKGASIKLWYPTGKTEQRFNLEPITDVALGAGPFTITNFENQGKRTTVEKASTTSGANIVLADRDMEPAQQYTVSAVATSTYTIKSVLSSQFLTVENGNLVQRPLNGATPAINQQWKAKYILGGIQLTNLSTGQAIVPNAQGTDLLLGSPSTSTAQAFYFRTLGDDKIEGVIVDLSKWDTVKDYAWYNINLAILRTSHGGYRTIDQKYKGYVESCKKYKVPYGCYNFAAYNSTASAKKEAKEMWDLAHRNGAAPKFYVIDVELIPDNWGSQSKKNMGKYTATFQKELRRLGAKKVGIYTGMYLVKDWAIKTGDFDFVWIPRYGKNNGKMDLKPTVDYDMWQYTSTGKIAGISNNVDLNVLNESGPNRRSFSWYTK